MDELSALKSLGFEWPSPAYIFGAIVFGLIGLAAFRYGRKSGRRRTLWLGVALMLYPYVVSPTWLLYAVGAALCALLWLDTR
jgi:MFS family permease